MRRNIALLLFLMGLCPLQGEDWDEAYQPNGESLVFNGDPIPDMELLESLSIYYNEQDYLIGLNQGLVLASQGDRQQWELLQLPVNFDIRAIGSSEDFWVVGGPDGAICVMNTIKHRGRGWQPQRILFFSDFVHSIIPSADSVDSIACLDSVIFVLADGALFQTTNFGKSWEKIEEIEGEVMDIVKHNGYLYVVAQDKPRETIVRLLRTLDGQRWNQLWEISTPHSSHFHIASFQVLFESNDLTPYSPKTGARLYLQIEGQMPFLINYKTILSTIDGGVWNEHGSYVMNKSYPRTDWNPLNFPVDRRYFPQPALSQGPNSGNLQIQADPFILAQYESSRGTWQYESIEPPSGYWKWNDWLGWHEVEFGAPEDLKHLLLASFSINQNGNDLYWMRTSTLGWIYMQGTLSPWLYRMEDGHWYWLDQYTWPPRAWDSVDQEWEDLTF